MKNWDALFYIVAQFIGAIVGVLAAALFARAALSNPAVNYATTLPGPRGVGIAFVAELTISFILMITVLHVSNTPNVARFTALIVGMLVAAFITFEAPLSGMSMNPARTRNRVAHTINRRPSARQLMRRLHFLRIASA
jgi:aquaporin Z